MKNGTFFLSSLPFVALFFAAALIFAASPAYACSCLPPRTVDVAFASAPAVALVKIARFDRAAAPSGKTPGRIQAARAVVISAFKGGLKTGDELLFPQGNGADCRRPFNESDLDGEMLVYLDGGVVAGGEATVSLCSRSNSRFRAAADLLYLENLAARRGRTRISGMVMREIAAPTPGGPIVVKPAANVAVEIASGRSVRSVMTNADGVYEIYDLPAGSYRVTPAKPPGRAVAAYELDRNVKLPPRGHVEASFTYRMAN